MERRCLPEEATPAFATTHWSVVLAAGAGGTPGAQAALESLCRTYWHPVFAFVRRRGWSSEDAADLTQEFFARLLAHDAIRGVTPLRGRFRAFLLVSLRHFLGNELDRKRAVKRGGGRAHLPFDELGAREREAAEAIGDASPDVCYERSWARALLDRVGRLLREECDAAGAAERYDLFEQFLPGGAGNLSYAELGERLGQTESAVRSAIHRFRNRYRALLRHEIALTVASPEEIDDEIRYLIAVVAG